VNDFLFGLACGLSVGAVLTLVGTMILTAEPREQSPARWEDIKRELGIK